MEKYICVVVAAPVRASSSHKAEMVTQLLLGEQCVVLKKENDFSFIQLTAYSYEGWVQSSQIDLLKSDIKAIGYANQSTTVVINDYPVTASIGSPIYNQNIQSQHYFFQYPTSAPTTVLSVTEVAKLFLGTPYLWGGKTQWGIDCSGLVQNAMACNHIMLPRDASEQYHAVSDIENLQDTKPGDLAFFNNKEGKIVHVGILLSSTHILHASGVVKIEPIRPEGIVNHITGLVSHKLCKLGSIK